MQKHSLSIVCGWFVVTLSLMIVASWHFDLTIQHRLLPNAPQSTPLTAVILLTLSIALRISRQTIAGQLASRWLWVCWGLSSAAVLTVLWVLLQDIFRLGPHVELEMYTQLLLQHGVTFLGQPRPHTAVSCFLVGLSIGLSPLASRWSHRTTLILGLVGFTVPWLALFDYVGLHNPFYALPRTPQTGMSPLTAIGLLALCAGVMGLRPAEGLVGFLTSASAGGQMVRWLVPVAVGAPLLFGWFAIYHKESDEFDSSVIFAFSWGITCLLHAALIIWTGVVLHKDDTEREKAAQEHKKTLAERQRTTAPDRYFNEESSVLQQRQQPGMG
jgi:hypothetical protein